MNIQNLMKQAQKMQQDLTVKQTAFNQRIFPGKYSLIELEMTGNKKLIKIKLENTYKIDAEDWEMLEDAILVAFNNIILEIETESKKIMGDIPNIPGMF